jgi:hypothetical protein
MPNVNSFADVTLDWEGLLAALETHPDLWNLLEAERLALESDLLLVRDLKARQEAHRAGRQEMTQQIKAVVDRGRGRAIAIRAVAKGKIGFRNEKLVHFHVAPVRSRKRKPEVEIEPPTDGPAVE